MHKSFATVCILALCTCAVAAAQEEASPPAIPFLEIGKVKLFRSENRIEVPGHVAVRNHLIELFACAPGGKAHESVLILDARPSNLNLAMKLLGLDDGGQEEVTRTVKVEEDGALVEKEVSQMQERGPNYLGDPRRPEGDRVVIMVRWEENGHAMEVRAEEMIFERGRNRTMPRAGWIYVGSRFLENPNTGRKEFMADHSKTVMSTWHDPDALIDNPLPDGGDDEVYFANPDKVPARGTPVILEIRVPTAEERRSIEAVEKAERERAEKERAGQGGGR